MDETGKERIDKWLWSVRVFKTRSQAAEACKKGRVIISDVQVKASRIVSTNETVVVRKPPVIYTFKILGIPKSRVGAKLVPDYLKDLTSVDELNKLNMNEKLFFQRDRGSGRPTKKERRDIDKLKNL